MCAAQARDCAVVGAGYWGKNLARNFAQLGALHSVVDADAERAGAIAGLYEGVAAITSIDDVLNDPTVGKLAIATPPHTHPELVEAALEAGKDVFVEKPICNDLDTAEDLAARARADDRVLMVGHLMQYHPVIRAAAGAIAEGRLGRVGYVECRRCNIGKIYTERNVLWNFGPHDLTLVLLALPRAMPVAVSCHGADLLAGGEHDLVQLRIRFDGGEQAFITLSWLSPVKEQRMFVYGDAGSLVVDDTAAWDDKCIIYPGHDGRRDGRQGRDGLPAEERPTIAAGEPLRDECAQFLACCNERREAETGPTQFLAVARLLDAAQRSLDADGREIDIA